jgi:hypothetical protein
VPLSALWRYAYGKTEDFGYHNSDTWWSWLFFKVIVGYGVVTGAGRFLPLT